MVNVFFIMYDKKKKQKKWMISGGLCSIQDHSGTFHSINILERTPLPVCP